MKTNLVLGSVAVLALVACSKKTPDAEKTTITSGTQDPTTPVQQPTTPTNELDNAGAPKTNSLNGNDFKDGGHIGTTPPPASRPRDNDKVHGNGTTPGTTGDLNGGDGK